MTIPDLDELDINRLSGLIADEHYRESGCLEFKTTTGELEGAGKSLCGFLNSGPGGVVLFGVTPAGKLTGQNCSEQTLHQIPPITRRFEPPISLQIKDWTLPDGKKVIGLRALSVPGQAPYVFDGRPYERVGLVTQRMPQEVYTQKLLARGLTGTHWESLPAGCRIDQLDADEIYRTVRLGIESNRLAEAAAGADLNDLLEKLRLSVNGELLNGAVVLYGTQFLPYYPQCHLKMARFKGTTKGEFLDSSKVAGNAFNELRAKITAEIQDRTLRTALYSLKEAGLVVSEGHGRGAAWRLTQIVQPGLWAETDAE